MVNDFSNVAVLIPCDNEEQTVEKVVADWKDELPGARIYVYDNNSTDVTIENALSIVTNLPILWCLIGTFYLDIYRHAINVMS